MSKLNHLKKFNEEWQSPMTPDEIIDELGYGRQDIDYVFEKNTGEIINIQFNDDGKESRKTYASAQEFLDTFDRPELKNYRDFYNDLSRYRGYYFIGHADGHSASLFA